ncbi:MAG: carbohydrate-binding protein [Methylococcaceae bacterium]|nr:carbohydrate-binding protein [Methylococcaceae bacterium]
MPKIKFQSSSILLRVLLSLIIYHIACVCYAYTFDAIETRFDANYLATPISLTGTVVTPAGLPLQNAKISVIAWGPSGISNANKTTTSDATGQFTLSGLARRNVLLSVVFPGHYSEIVPADLNRPLSELTTATGKIYVKKILADQTRLIFGGDTMIGRRFVDADGDGIEGEPGDLVRPATRTEDTLALLKYLRDSLSAADYTIVNLESTMASQPIPSNCSKSITFFSYPETLAGLKGSGIDGVNLGNNHIYDYLSSGLNETLFNVAAAGLDAAGAGASNTDALKTTIYHTFNNVSLSMLGFSQIVTGGLSDRSCWITARDGNSTEPAKPGALEASSGNIKRFLQKEAGRFAIPMIHGGTEYSSYPSNAMRSRYVTSILNNAGVVISHHPHTTQGIGLVNDTTGSPRFAVLSLGNLLFDQEVFETFQSYIVIADVEKQGTDYVVSHLKLVPIHHENYVPKLLTGKALARLGRDIGHLSTYLPTSPSGSSTPDGLRGAVVFPDGHRVYSFRDASQYTTLSSAQTLTAAVSAVTQSTSAIEFSRTSPSDMLSSIKTNTAATTEYGRDILKYGDFEDNDVDGDYSEGTSWSQTNARYIENNVVRSGTGALVLLRNSSNITDTACNNQNRISFPAGSKLTLRGWIRGQNSGTFKVRIRFYDKNGAIISTTNNFTKTPGTYGWTAYNVDVTAPANAQSLTIWYVQSPPLSGEGRVYIDDTAIVLWEGKNTTSLTGFSLPTPNNWSYFRFNTVAPAVANLQITLGHKTYSALLK